MPAAMNSGNRSKGHEKACKAEADEIIGPDDDENVKGSD
jgi:hypothetical protein